MKKETK